jgi:(p)ppGpp synthase/HD superfamily hydrolase
MKAEAPGRISPETRSYPQTNLQLFRAMLGSGYSAADVEKVALAYKLATYLFSGRYRPSGKPFINHLAGTAGILAAYRRSVDEVIAGLLHAAYLQGDFGQLSGFRSEILRQTVGQGAEALIEHYTAQPWTPGSIAGFLRDWSALRELDRSVIVLRLANELEDFLDLGMLYVGNDRPRLDLTSGNEMIQLAVRAGLPPLASDLRRVFKETSETTVPQAIRSEFPPCFSYVLPPGSLGADPERRARQSKASAPSARSRKVARTRR